MDFEKRDIGLVDKFRLNAARKLGEASLGYFRSSLFSPESYLAPFYKIAAQGIHAAARFCAPEETEYSSAVMERNAFHEAGHAVLSSTLFVNNEMVLNCLGDEKARGFVTFLRSMPSGANEDDTINCIAMALGGPYAEAKRYGAFPEGHMDDDVKYMEDILDKALGSSDTKTHETREAYKDKASRIAIQKLNELWPAVEIVAATALRKKILTGDEIREIIARNQIAAASSSEPANNQPA